MSYRYKVHRLPPAGKLHFLDLCIIPLVHRFLSMFLKASFRRIFKRLILVSSYHKRDILYKYFQAEFPKRNIISLLIPLSAVIIEAERGFYFAMDKCRERKYFYFRRQFSYVTGKNTDKYKAEVNESRQKTALD